MVTKTVEELEVMTPEELRAHWASEEKIVFGEDVQHRNNVPLEKGIGSPGHETNNHLAAIRRWEGEEEYQKAVAEIWKRDPARAKKLGLPERRAAK
jgi:hypothetical protein